ncbi:MAG: helix-turn-helix transcriptional regulator [Bacteroidota bacterium]
MNNLAKNIRFLRKNENWSQEKLAVQLNVKRSSIAAYESKNVEPRLKTMLELGKLFDVDIADLIEKDISIDPNSARSFKENITDVAKNQNIKVEFKETEVLKEFIDTTVNTRKMLDGLKVFYKFKTQKNGANPYHSDINSFIMLVEHLLNNNETMVNLITKRITS